MRLQYVLNEYAHRYAEKWDAMAQTKDTAHKFAETYINPEPKLKPDQQYSDQLEYCLATSAETINQRLRRDDITDIDKKIIDCISHYHTKRPLILYRGIPTELLHDMTENAAQLNTKNVHLYDKGFMCCSLVKSHELAGQTKLRIYVPENSSCIYQGGINFEPELFEVDIMAGAKLQILSIDPEYINVKLISTF